MAAKTSFIAKEVKYFTDIKRAVLLLSVQTDNLAEPSEEVLRQVQYHLTKAVEKLTCRTSDLPTEQC